MPGPWCPAAHTYTLTDISMHSYRLHKYTHRSSRELQVKPHRNRTPRPLLHARFHPKWRPRLALHRRRVVNRAVCCDACLVRVCPLQQQAAEIVEALVAVAFVARCCDQELGRGVCREAGARVAFELKHARRRAGVPRAAAFFVAGGLLAGWAGARLHRHGAGSRQRPEPGRSREHLRLHPLVAVWHREPQKPVSWPVPSLRCYPSTLTRRRPQKSL